MHRCLIRDGLLTADEIALAPEESRHLKTVLRIKPGDRVEFFDGCGATRPAVVVTAGRDGVRLEPVGPGVMHATLSCRLTLCACISKGARMEWTIEKAVELGVARVIPVISERTIVRLDERDGAVRRERWQRLAEEAARQCGSVWLPEIDPPRSLTEVAPLLAEMAPAFVAALLPHARPLREALAAFGAEKPRQAAWLVGPEGDYTSAEVRMLEAAGAIPVSLGKQVLRTDTAAIYGLCVLNCAWLVPELPRP